MKRLRLLFLAGLSWQTACIAAWHRVDLNVPQPLSPTQQIELWRGDSAIRWHVVDVTRDSIIGIPLDQPVTCASCHIAVARTQVDSVRWGDSATGFLETGGVMLLALASIVSTVAFVQAFGRD
ncbi:MAG TPA: hypothetical protein VEV39_15465 [Gemmatimonadales bacterium]|nr:hypothetical protein [Gemmatimonadales bacterium]